MFTHWLGKIAGLLVGYLLFGPIDAFIGFFIGHQFDVIRSGGFHNKQHIQQAFFNTTFLVMGHIAKADGRVSEQEIRVAEQTMNYFRLTPLQKQQAMNLFREGKDAGFNLDKTLLQFRQQCPFHRGFLRLFLEIQLRAAYADGYARPNVKQILQHIAQILRLGPLNFQYYDVVFGRMDSGAGTHYQSAGYTRPSKPSALEEAYLLLGVSDAVDRATLKKTYRRLMNQYHPDKLMAKGLPEGMIKVATEKTQKIQAAYETICQAKGFAK